MFKDKVVVITGGGHGIGKTTKEAFEAKGAKVEVIDIKEGQHFVGDIGKKDVLEDFVQYVLDQHGHIDYLINNALPIMKGIEACTYEEFTYALSVGVTAPFYLAKLFRNAFAPGGCIINISSS